MNASAVAVPAVLLRAVAALTLSGAVFAGRAEALTITLSPTDDTTIHQTEPNTTFGNVTALASGFAFPGTDAWIAYLKFDLGSIPTSEVITGATLSLFQFNGGGFAPLGTNLYRVSNDGWSEGTATWSSPPSGIAGPGPALGTLIATNPDGWDHRGWSTWDLFQLSAWNAGADRTDGALSLQLFETLGGTQTHNYCSKESDLTCLTPGESGPADALRRPFLTIETTTAPEPPLALLLASSLAAGRWLIRSRKASRGCS